MSTKTTIKRIALVAVSALGLGMFVAVSPAKAYTASFAVDTTSLTVVTSAAASYGVIGITTTDDAGEYAKLGANESITATVVAWPASETTSAPNNFVFSAFKRVYASGSATGGQWTTDNTTTETDGQATSYDLTQYHVGGEVTAALTGVSAGKYYLGIGMDQSLRALDKGEYTLRLRMTDANGFITDKTVKVKFVSSAADTGAKISVSVAGNIRTSETVTVGANDSITATLTDANGGRIQTGKTSSVLTTDATDGPGLPSLSAAFWGDTTPAVKDASTKFYVTDTGTNGYDHYSATSDSSTAFAAYGNGVYGLRSVPNQLPTVTASTVSPYVRFTYGSVEVTKAITVLGAVAGTAGTPTLTATGSSALVIPTNGINVPLTTKSVDYSITGATAGATYQYSVDWTTVATADMSVADKTPTAVTADSSGKVSFKITNGTPVDGATAVITVTGFATNPSDQTVTWKGNTAYTQSVSMDGAYVALKSTNVFVSTVTDIFGNPVAGVSLIPSLSTTSSNYAAATVYAPVTTDAKGQASFSLTDAKAVAAGTDKVTFTHNVATGAITAKSATITYAAAAPAPTALTATYSTTPSAGLTAITTAVPSTGIYYTGTTGFDLANTRNTGRAVTAAAGTELVIKIAAGVAGAAVTATASKGAYVLSSIDFESTSRTRYTNADGLTSFVVGTHMTGANTITFTSGAATTTVAFWGEEVDAATARFVTLTKGDGNSVVAKVTDRWGNGIPSASLQISTSNGTLGNGQVTTTYSTDLSGSVTFVPVGGTETEITAYAVTSQTGYTSLAGFVGDTAVDSSLAAGNRTAKLTVTSAVESSDAIDAANDAVEAANAATDAANAAAEAADAATAAAQDAQAAVADLAAQVATLISGIKAQITRLTNLVIKIQKKVNA